MPSGLLQLSITFGLACASATFFLFLRCHDTGPPFARNSRPWALLVILVTSVVSTAAAFVGLALVHHMPSAFLGVGIVGPSGLWLSEIRSQREERRSLLRDLSTLWLSRMLARHHEAMAEDRAAWCERHVNEDWSADELSAAAHFYQEYLRERMSPAERRRSRINAQVSAIEARLTTVQLIENGAVRNKVASALQGSRVTKEPRYSRNLNDLQRMADILHHDAERDLVRLIGLAYGAGLYRMPVFTPPRRTYSGTARATRPNRAGSHTARADTARPNGDGSPTTRPNANDSDVTRLDTERVDTGRPSSDRSTPDNPTTRKRTGSARPKPQMQRP